MNRCIPIWASGSLQDIVNRHLAAILWDRQLRPRSFVSGELHVEVLNLSATEADLDMKLQSNQTKNQLDRLVLCCRGLSGKRVYSVLMNELASRLGQRVVGKLVESLHRGRHEILLNSMVQLVSHVCPASSEKACSHRA